MMGQVFQLGLKLVVIALVAHELVHGRVAIFVHAVVMGLDQVALNVIKSFHLNSAHLLLAGPRPHRRILSTIDKLANDEDGHH